MYGNVHWRKVCLRYLTDVKIWRRNSLKRMSFDIFAELSYRGNGKNSEGFHAMMKLFIELWQIVQRIVLMWEEDNSTLL